MVANKRKILEAARKHAQKGAKDRALKEYERLLKLDPRDAKLRLEIGDAYRRWGQVEEAITAYTRVAEQYMEEGFDARAVAVFKQIQNLDPKHYASYVPLAELYQRMSLTSEAIQALQTAADGYHREGNKRGALELLRKMATLDPSNTTSRIKVADLLRQEGLHREAIAEYEEAHAELDRQGAGEAASNVLERILEIQPDRVPTLTKLAQNLLKRGLAERAEPFVKRALAREPDEAAHYELLADVYRAQQRDAELIKTYRSLAELYRRRGDEDRAREIIQRFVPPEGLAVPEESGMLGDEPLLEEGGPTALDGDLLDDELLDGGMVPGAAESPPEVLAEETMLELGHEAVAPEPKVAVPRQLDDELEPPELEIAGDPEQLLAEASVYLRYGKRGPAIKNLEAILDLDPQHRAALEKLGEAHADAGDSSAAVAAWLRAAERAREEGDAEGLVVLRDRIAALDEEAAASLGVDAAEPEEKIEELLEVSDAGGEPSLDDSAPQIEEPLVEAPEFEADEEIEIEVEDADAGEAAATQTPPGRDAKLGGESAPDTSAPSPSGASTSTTQQIRDDLEEAEFYRQQGLLEEAEAIYQRILEVAPNHPLALVRVGEIVAERGEDPFAAGKELAPPPERPEPQGAGPEPGLGEEVGRDLAEWTEDGLSDTGVATKQPPVAPVAEVPPDEDASQELDDTGTSQAPAPDTDVELGMKDESDAEPLSGAAAAETTGVDVPVHLPEAHEASEAVAAAPGTDAASFDLAAELSEALDEDEETSSGNLGPVVDDDGFSAVFREFKKGVGRALDEGDHEAHYDLGIAYREMGLLEDAIRQFQRSMTSPERRVDSLHMLGLCTLDLGRAQEATAHLRQALDAEQITEEQTLAVRFELGRAFETLGEIGRAREAWEAVAAVDAGFCEVAERLAALEEPKPDDEVEGDDEGFESFGDLFEEDGGAGASDSPEPVEAPAGESFEDLIAEANQAVDDEVGQEDGERATPAGASQPAPAPEPEPEPASEPEPPRRRKKKISFV